MTDENNIELLIKKVNELEAKINEMENRNKEKIQNLWDYVMRNNTIILDSTLSIKAFKEFENKFNQLIYDLAVRK